MIKILHIRECDEEGNLLNKGGCTIAYTCTKQDILLNASFCHPKDQFCKKIGREVAIQRLRDEGPLDIVELNHPISEAVRLWFMQYFGVGLKKQNGRYMTDWIEVAPSEIIPSDDPIIFQSEMELNPI